MKVARLGIRREDGYLYYLKKGDVWASPMKKPGSRSSSKGKAVKVASVGVDCDYSKFIYYLDGDGDVAAKARKNAKKR